MEQNRNKRKIGILGGSFDPIHMGHINIAQSAREEFELEEVWFIPAGHSPNKNEDEMVSAEDRAKMVELAVSDIPGFRLSRAEMDTPEISYTYLTLTRLQEQYPNTQFYFIMGADSLDYFEQWRHPEIICEKSVILAAVRDDIDLAEVRRKIKYLQKLFDAQIYPVTGGRTDISSTELRRQAGEGKTRLPMLPPKVLKYILEHGLYGCNEQMPEHEQIPEER